VNAVPTSTSPRFHEGGPRSRLGWLALLGGPVLWVLHIGLRYPLVPVSCEAGSEWPLHVVSIACTLGSIAVVAVAWRTLRDARRDVGARSGVGDEPDDPVTGSPERRRLFRIAFLARAGLVTSLVFLLVIVAEALTTIWHDPCTRSMWVL
jgi:hypothetical protein